MKQEKEQDDDPTSTSDRTFFTGSPNKGQGKEKEGRNHHVSTKFKKTEIFR